MDVLAMIEAQGRYNMFNMFIAQLVLCIPAVSLFRTETLNVLVLLRMLQLQLSCETYASLLFLRSLLVTTSKALVTSSDALVSSSFLLLKNTSPPIRSSVPRQRLVEWSVKVWVTHEPPAMEKPGQTRLCALVRCFLVTRSY